MNVELQRKRLPNLQWLVSHFPLVSQNSWILSRSIFALAFSGEIFLLLYEPQTSFAPESQEFAKTLLSLAFLFGISAAVGLLPRWSVLAAWACFQLLQILCIEPYHFDKIITLGFLLYAIGPSDHFPVWNLVKQKKRGAPVPRLISSAFFIWLLWIYGSSFLAKIIDPMWQSGSATWLAFTMPVYMRVTPFDLAELDLVFRCLTYGALLYEALFFLVIFPLLRRWIVVFGIGFHFLIAVISPLGTMSIGLAALVLMFLPWGPLVPSFDKKTIKKRYPIFVFFGWLTAGHLLCVLIFSSSLVSGPNKLPRPIYHIANANERWLGVTPHFLWTSALFDLNDPITRFELVTAEGEEIRTLKSHTLGSRPDFVGRQWKYFTFFQRLYPETKYEVISRYVRAQLRPEDSFPAFVKLYEREIWIEPTVINWENLHIVRSKKWEEKALIEIESFQSQTASISEIGF